ncbi:MAG: PAS domain-containing protein [Brevundimonas sp.]|nr:PAS domain-containing protein [Brevundimonas sp.]
MARAVRAFDWSMTPLGPIAGWPVSLKTTVGMLLSAPNPMVLLWGQEGVLIYNDGYARFAGRRHPELLGMGAREGWPEIADFNDLNIRRGLGGESWSLRDQELLLDRKGVPEPAWMDLDYTPVPDDSGAPGGVLVLVTETTERRVAEQTRTLAAERLDMALSAGSGIGAWDWDVVADRVTSDARFARLYGVDPEKAASGAPIAEFFSSIHPDDLPGVQARIQDAMATGGSFQAEYRLVDANGGIRWVAAAGRVSLAEDGTVARLPGVSFDITEGRRMTEALAESEERYRTLFTSMDEGFCIIEFFDGPHGPDSDYIHIEANPAYAANAGIENVVGQKLREMVGDEADAWVERYGAVLRTGEPIRFEQELVATGRWLELSAFRIEPPARKQVAVLFTDQTNRKRAEEALRELNATLEERVVERTEELTRAHEALRQSQKMEAVGQLTGGIAHDFNNLLAGISGSLELLSKRLHEGRLNGVERYIDAAQGAAQRAASLTQRLLAFSRRQTLDPKPTDVNRLISGMEELIRRSVGPDVEVEVVGAGGLWATRIDQSQLENALLNLCINARDAMAPAGGRLTIETANKWLDERHARQRELIPGQYVSLCVTDTGTGMSPEVQAQAFDPFFTTKPLGQGTGLGLSMIHGFVRQSGGQVRIYSELGKGTTMCLYLPRHAGDADDADGVGAAGIAEGGHGETVLVIDDETTVRMLVAEVLGDAGYHVIEAPDGPSGLEVLRSDVRIDLLISDVGLPGGMNGRQVADAARETRPDLKVLFITGYAENAAVGNGLLAPGMEVLTKPFVMADLALKVHDMIEA